MNLTNSTLHLPWHQTRRWSNRDPGEIKKIIIHQELGDSNVAAVNNYHIRPNHISPKGCPHFCYHFGIEKSGEIIQANELSHITWHTAGQNEESVGIMLVGSFRGPGHDMGTEGPEARQFKALDWLCDYLLSTLTLSNQEIYGHYHFGKPACPGYSVQEWIEGRRNLITDMHYRVRNIKKTPRFIQTRLKKLGYYDAVADGIIGVKTLWAIREFQRDNGLVVDGIVGPVTWKRLLVADRADRADL